MRRTMISVNCTLAAITRMNVIVRRYSRSSGTSTYACSRYAVAEESVSTNAVAKDMPAAASRLRETPRNGHRPRNRTSTKLLTSTVLTRMTKSSAIPLVYGLLDAHARLCAFVGRQQEYILTTRTGGKHHALGNTKAHLARREICHNDHVAADKRRRIVRRLDTGEHVTLLVTQIQRQGKKFVGAFNRLGMRNARNAKVDLHEVVDADEFVFCFGFGHGRTLF